jgi:hypothetical protein
MSFSKCREPLAGRGGELMLIGIQPAASMLSAREIVMSELSIDGSVSLVPEVDLPEALRVLRTRVEGWHDIAPMVFPLRDVAEQGLRGSAPARIKTLFSPVLDAPMPLTEADRFVGGIAASSTAMSDPQLDPGGHR